MTTVNIRRDVKDSFYRYKMPELVSKVEGKGNGIKTVIPNMSLIATSLARPPSYPTKFFGIELGAQVKSDEKTDKYIVNGAHDAKKLQELLDSFIKKFVLCPSCQNPETDLVIKNEEIIMLCQACGTRNSADNRHKLVAYILKNPPPKKSSKKYKNGGNTTPPDEGNKAHSGSADAGDADSDDELTRKIAAEAAHLPTAAEIKIQDDDWSVDTSEEAVAARMKELKVTQSLLADDFDDDEEGGESKYELFGKWLEEQGGPAITASDEDIIAKAEEFGVSGKHKAVQVLVQCLFDEGVMAQVGKRARLLATFGHSEKHQKSILGALERLIGLSHPALLKKVPIILKTFYDADLIEEEVILKWGEKASKKYVDRKTSEKVKDAAAPFLEWLKNAESEEESGEEDDEDDDEDE